MKIDVTLTGGEQPRTLTLSGRIGQTIYHLWQAGPAGITAQETPALRLAAYVHSLREMGFAIETQMEPHDGRYSGHHARYILRTAIVVTHGVGGNA